MFDRSAEGGVRAESFQHVPPGNIAQDNTISNNTNIGVEGQDGKTEKKLSLTTIKT